MKTCFTIVMFVRQSRLRSTFSNHYWAQLSQKRF